MLSDTLNPKCKQLFNLERISLSQFTKGWSSFPTGQHVDFDRLKVNFIWVSYVTSKENTWKEHRHMSGHPSLCLPGFSWCRLKFGGLVTKQWVVFQVRGTKKAKTQPLQGPGPGRYWGLYPHQMWDFLPQTLFCPVSSFSSVTEPGPGFLPGFHYPHNSLLWQGQEKLQRMCTSNKQTNKQTKKTFCHRTVGGNLNFLYLSFLSVKWG